MVSTIFKLTFPDGQIVTGKVSNVAAPEDDAVIAWSGPAERLPFKWETVRASLVKSLSEVLAAMTGAKLAFWQSGNYDCWSE